ncbi:MAG TPA: MFS transporter [Thermoanaerobaculia bacterium]|nr:MFS transporter [Thermoanaerobaculia bacterium]
MAFGRVGRERIVGVGWGLLFTAILAALIVGGSRNLQHFDAALVGYTFAVLFATFAITYRYSMWLQRPPTRRYWRRGWQVFFSPKYIVSNIVNWFRRVTADFAMNRFIFKRSASRGLAHALIMWGCILAFAITFPLVFGWIHFETVPGDVESYTTFVFGFPTQSFEIHSLIAFLVFHGLVWSSFLVIAGVMLAMRRRMRDHGAAALQRFAEDFLPLILLFAISITGLLLTASYTWMQGYGYDFLALLHAITVIFTLLYMPFGKFFHIFQRPAQLGVSFYKDVAAAEGMAKCRRCEVEFAPLLQINDLIEVERELGYRYETSAPGVEHYQRICPSCRRTMLGIAQGMVWGRIGSPGQHEAPSTVNR